MLGLKSKENFWLIFLLSCKRRKDLENEFGRFGNIMDIMIPVDYHTRLPKGYCFIEFEDYYQAEDAFYSLHMSTFFGEKIEIDYAKSDWKSN